jgi:flagellar protein FliS
MNPAAGYRATQVNAASPAERVVLLYEGALRFSRSSIVALERGDRPGAHTASVRAQEIVGELRATIDLTSGGEIASSLDALYDFVIDRLLQGNIRRDAALTNEAIRVIEELIGAWRQIAAGTPAVAPTGA